MAAKAQPQSEILGEYHFAGDFYFFGHHTEQRGSVYHFSNNVIAGSIEDKNKDPERTGEEWCRKRLLLGLYFPEKDSLGIIRLDPGSSDTDTFSIAYLESQNPFHRQGIDNNYKGKWGIGRDMTPIEDLQQRLGPDWTWDTEDIKTIPAEALRFLYFNEDNIRSIMKPQCLFVTGNLSFIKRR